MIDSALGILAAPLLFLVAVAAILWFYRHDQ